MHHQSSSALIGCLHRRVGGFHSQSCLAKQNTRKAMASRGAELSLLKQCLIRRNSHQEHHGVAVSNLHELRRKARDCFAIDKALEAITLVLAEDGTIVDDEEYFLCLPPNTKFVVLAKDEKWSRSSIDGGTAWLKGEVTAVDGVDGGGERWQQLARQLKEDLSAIILMSEEDLQALIDVPCSDLARELSESQAKVQTLQDTLQQVLDRREEERQSRQVLELYLQAVKNGDRVAPKTKEPETATEGNDMVDAGSSGNTTTGVAINSHILTALKEKPAPELSLASQELELVSKEDPQSLSHILDWDKPKTEALQQACKQELSKRLQQVQALHSLRSISKGKKKLPWGEWMSSKRKK